MAEGFRVTQDGNIRVTESLDRRVTEQYAPLYASSSLDAAGTQVFVAGILLGVQSDLVGSLSQLAANTFTAGAVATVQGSGSVAANAEWYKNFQASLNSSGTAQSKLGYLFHVSVDSSSAGSISLQPDIIRDVSSSLNAATSYDYIPELTLGGESDVMFEGSLGAIPSFTAKATSANTAALSVDAKASLTMYAAGSLQASSDFQIYPLLIQAAASLVGGTGVVNAYGGFLASGEAGLNSNGILNGTSRMILNAIVISEDLRRVTEDGNPRIIHTGEFRGAYGSTNMITATVSGDPTVTPFNGQMFGHRNGEYRPVIPNVKRNGSWVVPKVYVKDNDTWKRVY